MSAHAHSPAEIEGDIRRTRAEMDETIDALKLKLSPGQLLDQALGYVKEGGSEVGANFVHRVKANPIPLAVLAGSLAWLMMSERRPEYAWGSPDRYRFGPDEGRYDPYRDDDYPDYGAYSSGMTGVPPYPEDYETDNRSIETHDRVRDALAGLKHRSDDTADSFSTRYYEAKAGALGLKQNAEEQVHAFRERVDAFFHDLTGKAHTARTRLSERTHRASERARASARAAGRAMDRAGVEMRHLYADHPLMMGAVGIAAGALLGSLIPSTREEQRVLGDAGERLHREAAARGHDALDAARNVATRATDEAIAAAEREGLTPENAQNAAKDIGERVRRVGEDALRAGHDEAHHRVGGGGRSAG